MIAALIVAAVLAGRSIARPLDALAREADDVALRRLPESVARIQSGELVQAEGGVRPPSSAQEISRFVAALHNVERTAVGLAAEQAVLRRNTAESLASLGRRNQGLVRQLSLITALEQQELDQLSVLRDPQWAGKLTAADRRGLSPLFWSHVNPYARFHLGLDSRLDIARR